MQVSWADYDEDEELALVADPWADVDGRTAAVSADDQPTLTGSACATPVKQSPFRATSLGRIPGSACATVSIPFSANDLPTVGAEDPHESQAAGTDEHQTANANKQSRTWVDVVGRTTAADVNELSADTELSITQTRFRDSPQLFVGQEGFSPTVEGRQRTYEPGESVGIRAVHSILMSATQMNLSHFHTAGMHSSLPSSRPVPSPAEALNDVYVNTSMTFESSDNVHTLRKHIVGANLSSFVKSVGGSFTWLPDQENVWYEVLQQPMYDGNIIRLYIQFKKMRNHGLTLRDLADTSFGTDVVTHVSPDFMGMIDIEVPNDHLSQWLSRMGTPVCGTPKVKSCEKVGDTAVTHGTDVLTLSKVSTVNSKTITSNDVNEVLMLYGIEAAAAVLYDLTKSPVVSDFMARTGRVLYFTKNSLEVARKGLLTSMGFERPKNDIKEALIRPHMYNSCRPSVKESIMTGTRAACDFEIHQE